MRALRVTSGLVLCLAYACTSTSSNTPDPIAEGGSSGIGGGSAGTSLVAGAGGSPSAGAGAPSGGTREVAGMGGTNEESGGGNSGGTADPGATPAEGGAGGASECMGDGDCENPHRPTCTAQCKGGRCELAPSSSLSMAIQSGPKDAAPRGGFWDSRGNAHIVYPSIGSVPNYIAVQALDADGALSGFPPTLSLPEETSEIDMVAAAYREPDLGLLWHGTEESTMQVVTRFTLTTLEARAGTTVLLNARPTYDLYHDDPHGLYVSPRAAHRWNILTYTGKSPRWRAYTLNMQDLPAMPPLEAGLLQQAPVAISQRDSTPQIGQATAVVGDTLFVTGFDCEWSSGNLCEAYLVFARYDRTTYDPLAMTFTTISTTSYPMADQKQRQPALASVGGRLAAMWTQHSEDGELLLGRAVFNEDGSVATVRTVEASDLIPKALVESPGGGALLIAVQVSGTAPDLTYKLVAQRVDADLDPIGSPTQLNMPSAEDPTHVAAIPSGDGRVLLIFRQKYAQHRILHADLCQ